MQGWVSRMCTFWKYRKHLAVLFAVLLLPFLTSHVQLWIPPNELDGWISVWVKLFSKDTWIHPRLLYLDTSKYSLCFVSYSSYSWMLVIIGLVEDKFFYRLCVGGGVAGLRLIQVNYIYHALYFYYYYISSTSDHQVLDSGGWRPLSYRESF